jgi:virginiamycin B lyase
MPATAEHEKYERFERKPRGPRRGTRGRPASAGGRINRLLTLPLAIVAATAVLAGCSAAAPGSESGSGEAGGQAPAPRSGPAPQRFAVPDGAGPHDVAPAADGGVWFTAQSAGYLGHLDPKTRKVTRVPLGDGSAPHGVITGPGDGADAWVTDGGLNAIVRVEAGNRRVHRFPLPAGREDANLNTATFDRQGVLWFTGQNGIYGRLDPRTGKMQVYDAPGGRGPYGITTTPRGEVFYASLAGSHIAQIDIASGKAKVLRPPTADQGSRRVWADASGNVWVSEYNAGRLARYTPSSGQWKEWPLPGDGPQPYAVFVDEAGKVWSSDFGSNRLLAFDPATERFTATGPAPAVRQIHGRAGEVWGAASGDDQILLVRTR